MPPRKRAIVSSGRCVALRPIRCGGVLASGSRRRSRRSRLRARWAPRLVPAMAWTSSTMTYSTLRRISRAWLVSSRYRLSGVVIRMSGGRRAISRRSSLGVSPVRAGDGDARGLCALFLCRVADPGERGAQVALDVVGQGLERGDVEDTDVTGVLSCCRWTGVAGEAVEGVEEGGEGLAAAGGGMDERVVALRDGGPAACLGLGRRLEARLEPCPDGW